MKSGSTFSDCEKRISQGVNHKCRTSKDSNSKQFKAEAYPGMVLALTLVAEVDGATGSLLVVLCLTHKASAKANDHCL
jgi:hypothetical protein